jgi:hypothetical protein
MGVLFRPRSAICKRENGEHFLFSTHDFLNILLIWSGDNRQVNVDYSVCTAFNFHTNGLHKGLLVYDVFCQYGVNFEKRIREASKYLSKDPEMEIFGAIGKFHLADHVDDCFSKWTLNFMKGAGHVDGEIMETLWSGMNKISGAARSMSKAHRQETLDDYMRDSNWKKTVGISEFLFPKPIVD